MSFSPGPSSPHGSNSVLEQRERWERKRTRTAKALVQTEQTYCQQLQLVTTFFVDILNSKGTLKPDVRQSVFSSIKHIHSLNQSLLVHLENGYFGRGFEKFCPELQHYITYVDNIYSANRVLQTQLKKSKAFRRFKKLQESRPEFKGQTLEQLLELPLLRIDQYKHFLQDLTASTCPNHPEFQQLSQAVRTVSDLSQRIEDNARRHENHLQLCRVQKLLKGRKTKLMAPGRWYIREGCLKVVPTKGKEAKAKMFFLFSDVLLQTTRCSPLHPTNGDKFEVQQAFPLKDCSVEKVFGHTRSQGGLLSLTFPKAKLLLMSSDKEDFSDWCQSLSGAVRKLQSKSTVVHDRERPTPKATFESSSSSATNRKRTAANTQSSAAVSPRVEADSSAPKRRKQDAAAESLESSSSSCVIL